MRIFDDVVLLEYRREGPDLYTYAGTTTIKGQAEGAFQGASFEAMLEFAGDALRQYQGYRLVLKRAEHPYPMTLPPGIEELLRDDTAEAIRRLTIPPQRIEVRERTQRLKTDMLLGELRHGLDTLADALGDEVYIKLRSRLRSVLAEDPITGRWVELQTQPDKLPLCSGLQLTSQIFVGSHHWATVRTADIIALGLGRYWLPRGWNRTRGWIEHAELVELYDSFKKEREDAYRPRSNDSAEPGLATQ